MVGFKQKWDWVAHFQYGKRGLVVRGGDIQWRYDGDRCELVLRSLKAQGRLFALLNHTSRKRLWGLIMGKGSWTKITLPTKERSLKPKDFILCSKPRVLRNVFLFDVLDGECRVSTDCSFGMLEQQAPIPLNLGLDTIS